MAAKKKKKPAASKKSEFVGRNDLVVAVAKHTGEPQTKVLAILNVLLGSIRLTVKSGRPVRLAGFGVFRQGTIKARKAKVFAKGSSKNNIRQVTKNLPASTVARFKPSAEFLA